MDGRSRCMRSGYCSSIVRVLRWIVCSVFDGFLEVLSGMLTGMLNHGGMLPTGAWVPGPRYA